MQLLSTLLLTLFAANSVLLVWLLALRGFVAVIFCLALFAAFFAAQIWPEESKIESKRLKRLRGGATLLAAYLLAMPVSIAAHIYAGIRYLPADMSLGIFLAACAVALLATGIVFLNGGLRVFASSVQLGIKWRVHALIFWWVPVVSYAMAWRAFRIAHEECRFELAKYELDHVRAENEICKTKYPILLVHGVFFRDSQFLNYWGRVPAALIQNGAAVYYGKQQSAASVADSAAELAARIHEIVSETGCEKVNIIAHSKGGLDSRYAISCLGAAPEVASLTTINTPHHGCVFAEELLKVAPQALQDRLAKTYNGALRRLGDSNPNFLAAIYDLTNHACESLNSLAPDADGVYYASVGSYVENAKGGRFPLNVSHDLVKHFDGKNDGLVSIDSAKWGERFTLLSPKGKRGITHADVIDLGRENVPGFDVREFYVNYVEELKQAGF